MPEWLQRALDALDQIFERRLRRASGLDQPAAHAGEEEEDAGEVEIVNISRGTPVGPREG